MRQDICCILGIGVIFKLALPTGKFPLWRQGLTPWNPKLSDEGGGNISSDWMTFSEGRLVVVVNCYPLTTERGNVVLHHSVTTTDWREDGQDSHFFFLVSEPVYPLLWVGPLLKLWIIQGKLSPNQKGRILNFLYDMHHPLFGLEFRVWEIFMTHGECVCRCPPPHHHSKILSYKHHPFQPLHIPCVWSLLPGELLGVQHTGD